MESWEGVNDKIEAILNKVNNKVKPSTRREEKEEKEFVEHSKKKSSNRKPTKE